MIEVVPVMNDTKWDEVRAAMLSIDPRPMWRSRDRDKGFVSEWDGGWYYHFRIGGYETLEWVEIRPNDDGHASQIVAALRRIGVPGLVTDRSITVFGYVESGQPVDWI